MPRLPALLLALLLLPGVAAAQPAPAPLLSDPAAVAPELTEADALFAWHRLAGTEPDFRILAELLLAAAPPPPPARDPVADRRYRLVLAERRLRASFAAFDLDRPFSLTLHADILGFDRERGVMPLRAGLTAGLWMPDPTNRDRGLRLRFRNPESIAVVPAEDGASAAARLEAAGLASFGDRAGAGLVTLSIVPVMVLPKPAELSDELLSVEIVAARVEGPNGVVLHRFNRTGTRAAMAAARRAGPPTLASAELAGLRIGMTLEAALALAEAAYPEPFGTAFYAALPELARRMERAPACSDGLVADIRAFAIPLAQEASFAGCLAVMPDEAMERVEALTQLRFLPGGLALETRADLQERFGPPLEDLPNGALVWIGRDPAPGGVEGLLELRALFVRVEEGGPRREPGVLLALTLRRHVPPGDDGS